MAMEYIRQPYIADISVLELCQVYAPPQAFDAMVTIPKSPPVDGGQVEQSPVEFVLMNSGRNRNYTF